MRSALLHRGQAVRDHQRSAAALKRFQRLLHHALAGRIQRARRFVEQQDRPIGEQRARDREALALAARKRHAALAEHGIHALRQAVDKFQREGLLAGALCILPARVWPAVAHVVEDAGGENHRVLRHHGDQAPQGGGVVFAQVGIADAHAALLRIVEAQQQREHRGLARAGWPHQRDMLALRHGEREAVERGRARPRRIRERDSAERNLGVRRAGRRHRGRGNGRFGIQDLHQALGRAGRALQLAPDFRHRAGARRHDEGVEHEGRQLARRQAPGEHVVPAHPQDHADRAERDQHHRGDQEGLLADARDAGAVGGLGVAREAARSASSCA